MGLNIIPDFKAGKFTLTEVNGGEAECYYVTTNVFKTKYNGKVITYRFGIYVSAYEMDDIRIAVYAIPTFDTFNSCDILEIIAYGVSTFDLDIKDFIEKFNDDTFCDIPMMMTEDGTSNKAYKLGSAIHISDKELFNKAKGKYSLSDNAYFLCLMSHYVNNVFDFGYFQDRLSSAEESNKLAKIVKLAY